MQAELSQLRHLLDVGTAPLPVSAATAEPSRAESAALEHPRIRLVDSGAPPSPASPDAPPAPTPADWELSFENAIGKASSAPAPSRPSGPRAVEKEKVSEPNPFDDLERPLWLKG